MTYQPRTSTKPLDDELERLRKELVRARKTVAEFIAEDNALSNVQDSQDAAARRLLPGGR